jgi:hypothetical protein
MCIYLTHTCARARTHTRARTHARTHARARARTHTYLVLRIENYQQNDDENLVVQEDYMPTLKVKSYIRTTYTWSRFKELGQN